MRKLKTTKSEYCETFPFSKFKKSLVDIEILYYIFIYWSTLLLCLLLLKNSIMILQFSEHAFIYYFSVIRRHINRHTHNFANAILFRILTINEIVSRIVLTIIRTKPLL